MTTRRTDDDGAGNGATSCDVQEIDTLDTFEQVIEQTSALTITDIKVLILQLSSYLT